MLVFPVLWQLSVWPLVQLRCNDIVFFVQGAAGEKGERGEIGPAGPMVRHDFSRKKDREEVCVDINSSIAKRDPKGQLFLHSAGHKFSCWDLFHSFLKVLDHESERGVMWRKGSSEYMCVCVCEGGWALLLTPTLGFTQTQSLVMKSLRCE